MGHEARKHNTKTHTTNSWENGSFCRCHQINVCVFALIQWAHLMWLLRILRNMPMCHSHSHSHCRRYFIVLCAYAKQINYKNAIFKMSSANIMTATAMAMTTKTPPPAATAATIIQYADAEAHDDDEFVHFVNGRNRQTSKWKRLKWGNVHKY